MLTINSTAAAAAPVPTSSQFAWLGTGGGLLFACVLLAGCANRKRPLWVAPCARIRAHVPVHAPFTLTLLAAAFLAAGCGGGGNQTVQPPPPPTVGTAFSVVVSATSSGIVHNAKITVVVR